MTKTSSENNDKVFNDKFELEKQISKNWNLFLYDLCLQKIDVKKIIKHEYNDEVFGSWFVELQDKRLIYDGKDFCLIIQIKKNKGWIDQKSIQKENMTYSQFVDDLWEL